jgi:hypothetical protein
MQLAAVFLGLCLNFSFTLLSRFNYYFLLLVKQLTAQQVAKPKKKKKRHGIVINVFCNCVTGSYNMPRSHAFPRQFFNTILPA